jgi:hypothetical protein
MIRILSNFAIVFAAVLAGLFVYARLSGGRHPLPAPVQEVQDFGIGQIRARKDALSEGFRVADGVRTAYAEYYSNVGKLPTGNAEIGVQPPGAYQGKSIRRIEVSERGITITYNEQAGADYGRVIFEPEAVEGNINWKCVSPSFPDIAALIPSCAYRKQGEQQPRPSD